MKVMLDISKSDLRDIMRLSGVKKGGPAVEKFIASGLMRRRGWEFSKEVMSGKFRVEFPDWRKARKREQR